MKNIVFKLYAIFSLCVLIEPSYCANISKVHYIYGILKVIVSSSILLMIVIHKNKINWLIVTFMVFEGTLMVSTLLNSLPVKQWFTRGAYAVILLFFMQLLFDTNPKLLFDAFSIVLGSYVHINLLTYLLFPQGLFTDSVGWKQCWFLGYDNVSGVIIITAIIISIYSNQLFGKCRALWNISVILSGIVFSLLTEIVTLMLIEIVIAVFLIIQRLFNKFNMKIKCLALVIFSILLFIAIQIWEIQTFFSGIFMFFGKNATLSKRTFLWARAWKDISKSILLGYGVGTNYINHFHMWWAAHLHSYYLQILYEGGISSFIAFCLVLLIVAKKFDENTHLYMSSIAEGGLLSLLLIFQVEAYFYVMTFFAIYLFLVFYAGEIETVYLTQYKAKLNKQNKKYNVKWRLEWKK